MALRYMYMYGVALCIHVHVHVHVQCMYVYRTCAQVIVGLINLILMVPSLSTPLQLKDIPVPSGGVHTLVILDNEVHISVFVCTIDPAITPPHI